MKHQNDEPINSQLISLFSVLNFDTKPLFTSLTDTDEPRTPFSMEKELLTYVAQGKPNEMITDYKNLLSTQGDLHISFGKLSKDEIRQIRYVAVSAIAIVCRVAMFNGAPEKLSYERSDKAILKIDKMQNPNHILLFLTNEVYKYAELVAQSKEKQNLSKIVRQSVDYIAEHLSETITVEDLASQTSYNKEYFAKIFKKEMGQTLSDYILEQRINRAKQMILDGKNSQDISYMLNFSSQSYFIKQFKKVTGVTPREYALMH